MTHCFTAKVVFTVIVRANRLKTVKASQIQKVQEGKSNAKRNSERQSGNQANREFGGNELPQAKSVRFGIQRESEYLQLLGRWQQIVLHDRESGDRTLPQ